MLGLGSSSARFENILSVLCWYLTANSKSVGENNKKKKKKLLRGNTEGTSHAGQSLETSCSANALYS